MNTQQKPFDNPKVRQAIAYAINKEALAKVAFNGYATPAEGVVPQGVEYAVKIGPWPYDVAKAQAAADRGRLSERLRDRAVVGATTTRPRRRSRSSCSSSCSRSASRPRSRCSRPGSASRRSRAGRIRRRRRCACTTSAGRRRPAKPTGRCVRCSHGESWPPKLFNTAYYKNDEGRRRHQEGAQLTTDRNGEGRSSTRTRRKRSGTMRRGRRSSRRSCCRRTTRSSSGVYVMPDASFNFTEIDLK